VVGGSGAVMGVLIAFAMTNPDREFYLIPLPVPINARALVLIVVLLNVMSAVSGTNTSVATHFGGMLTGFAYMKLAPVFRRWRGTRARKPPDDEDPVGDAVNNIFRFEEGKRKRR
jgi:membrane associated rhomboid family serine protease